MDKTEQMNYKKQNLALAKLASVNGWISVEDQLPDLNVNVLMYYELETTDEGIYPYLEIGYLSNPMPPEDCEDLEWMDKEHNSLSSPVYWMPLPNLPRPLSGRAVGKDDQF